MNASRTHKRIDTTKGSQISASNDEDPRTTAARKILENVGKRAVAVSKPVRGGFTTSIVIAARTMNKSVVCISPTRRILNETVDFAASGNAVRVPGNVECRILEQEIEEYPILADLPNTLPDCKTCEYFDSCPVTEILRVPNFSTASLTYAKIQALMTSKSPIAEKMRQKLSKADFVLLDEAHTIGFGSVPSVTFGQLPSIPSKFKALTRICRIWDNKCELYKEKSEDLMARAKLGHAGQHLSELILIIEDTDWQELLAAWGELRRLAKSGEMSRAELITLRDAIEIISGGFAFLQYLSENNGQSGRIWISGTRVKGERALKEFLHNVVPYAAHIFASGTLIEPHEEFFAELSGKDVETTIFPDVMGVSEKLTLIPDSWKLTAWNFKTKMPDIIDQIEQICEREKQPIYILCPNAEKAGKIRDELKEKGIEDFKVDYHRSDETIGVAHEERVCICIGMAETPANSCDPLAREPDAWLDSRKLRYQSVHAATWQGINRVRDPKGEEESRVYMIGVRLDEVRELAKWGPGRWVETIRVREFEGGRSPEFRVRIDEQVENCRILGESGKKDRPDLRRLDEYIEKIEIYNRKCITSQKYNKSSIYYYRGNVGLLSFYNNPENSTEMTETAKALNDVFVNRDDVHAQQVPDGKGGWKYVKRPVPLTPDKLRRHIAEEMTLATYQINPDSDTVIWGCFDIDTHGSEDSSEEARAKLKAIIAVLRSYSIPFLVEDSGSLDSYHIWVFFHKTKTYNAYTFMKQVAMKAKVKKIEIWPKQKKITKKHKYGNLLKIPLCYHNKSGRRSAFIDPDTLQPLEGRIPHPGCVHLLDIPERTPGTIGVQGMPHSRLRKRSRSRASDNELDYCMIQALQDGIVLSGSEGHIFRLAIADKALRIDMPVDDVINLFANQPDFSPEITRKNVEYIKSRKYYPYSCEKLGDQCPSVVLRYCETCPRSPRSPSSGEVTA